MSDEVYEAEAMHESQEQIQGSQGTPRSHSSANQRTLHQTQQQATPPQPGEAQQQEAGEEEYEPEQDDENPEPIEDAKEGFRTADEQSNIQSTMQYSTIQPPGTEFLYDEEITKHVENEKLEEIHRASQNLKANLAHVGRCPICTLLPPCKHYGAQQPQPPKETRQPNRINTQRQQNPIENVLASQDFNPLMQDSLFKLSDNQPFTQRNVAAHQNQTTRNIDQRSFSIGNNSIDVSRIDYQGSQHNQLSSIQTWDYNQPTQKAQFHVHHKQSMEGILAKENTRNDQVSPYSILRNSGARDIDETIQSITMGLGPRSNRSQLLRQLALKQKIQQNPFLHQKQKINKNEAENNGLDPHFNDNNLQHQNLNGSIYPKGILPHQLGTLNPGMGRTQNKFRIRDKRGQYQSIDTNSNLLPAVGNNQQRAASQKQSQRINEYTKAQKRLRVIDQISKYREDKIKQEFFKLEADLRQEDDKQQKMHMKDQQQSAYHAQQKAKLAEYGMRKHKALEEKAKKLQNDAMMEKRKRQDQINQNEEIKAKIRMYKEYKAQQILELQMREQNIIASSTRKHRTSFYPMHEHNQQVQFSNQIGKVDTNHSSFAHNEQEQKIQAFEQNENKQESEPEIQENRQTFEQI